MNRLYGKDGRWRDCWGNDKFLLGMDRLVKSKGESGGVFFKLGR